MNAWLKILAAVSVSSLASTVYAASTDCTPQAVTSPTKFPMRSQLRGQEGTVLLTVRIDDKGHVASTDVAQSSGYRLLDRAAIESVQRDWIFDISGCERKDLPADHLISVEYRNDEYR